VATQSYANVDYGPEGLERLAKGQSAKETVDAKGRSASFTGSGCKHWYGHIEKPNFCAQGNILTGEEVVRNMASSYERAQKKADFGLADWMALAMVDGQKAGGDSRGRQSAALLVVRKNGGYGGGNDRFIDLRVDDHKKPIAELLRLLSIHKKMFAEPTKTRRRQANLSPRSPAPSAAWPQCA